MKTIQILFAGLALIALTGCSNQPEDKSAPSETIQEVQQNSGLPDNLFLREAPGNAVSVSEARELAKKGEEITFKGYIGGRVEPFTDGRALFVVADEKKAPACEDGCKTYWDACCTSGDIIAANSATVQIVDENGKLLQKDIRGTNGLEPGAVVAVRGKVREVNENILIVDAIGISTE
jgi:hypothetical protein